MSKKISLKQTGLALAVFFGLLHILWTIGVGVGIGQFLADSWHSIHFISDQHLIGSFDLLTALIGTIEAIVLGYLAGIIFALIWNWSGKKIR